MIYYENGKWNGKCFLYKPTAWQYAYYPDFIKLHKLCVNEVCNPSCRNRLMMRTDLALTQGHGPHSADLNRK